MNDRIWTKDYILLMASNFFVAVNFYALMATVADFAISDLGMSEAMGGFGAGIFVIGALISRIVIGRYTTRLDLKKTLLIGIGALIVCTALLFTAKSFAVFCVIRFLGGLTFGVNNNILMTAVTYIIPESRKGEGVN
ncbi:MAG: MFS transporter, partial [Clostridiales bacterium]|nr:MFS transporter [Clostridiales bacterium]